MQVVQLAAAAVVQQDSEQEVEDDYLFLKAAENIEQGIDEDNTVSPVADQYNGDRARLAAIKRIDWLEKRLVGTIGKDLERIFGPGATKVALDYQMGVQAGHVVGREGRMLVVLPDVQVKGSQGRKRKEA